MALTQATRVGSYNPMHHGTSLESFLDNIHGDWVQAENFSTFEDAVATGKNVMYRGNFNLSGGIKLAAGQSIKCTGKGHLIFTDTAGCFITTSDNCFINVTFRGPAASAGIVLEYGSKRILVKDCVCHTTGLMKTGTFSLKYADADWHTKSNISEDVLIINPKGYGPNQNVNTHNFLETRYVNMCSIIGGEAHQYYYGHMYWGGDSDVSKDGERANVRKCDNIFVDGFRTFDCLHAGSWGSMGNKVRRFGVTCVRSTLGGDVGIDDEGTVDAVNVGCYAEGYQNGNYASFWSSTSVQFVNCTSRQYAGRPHFRNYNATQQAAKGADIAISGGNFITLNPNAGFATIDTGNGAARSVVITDLALQDSVITLRANNNGTLKVDNIYSRFTVAGPSTEWFAVDATSLASKLVSISNINVEHDVNPSSTGVGIRVRSGYSNGAGCLIIENNKVPNMNIVLREEGGNATYSGFMFVYGNITTGIRKEDQGKKAMTVVRQDNNFTRQGVAVIPT